jgi:tetratricopeptide (TPR) repeat protein
MTRAHPSAAVAVATLAACAALAVAGAHAVTEVPAPRPPSADKPATLASLIDRCRRGDCGGASAELASWPRQRVVEESAASAGGPARQAATVVLLNTGAAILHREFGVGDTPPPLDPVHLTVARRLMAALTNRSKTEPALRAFCSNWFVLIASAWSSSRRYPEAERDLRAAMGPLDDDPDVLLAAGSAAEALMGPYPNTSEAIAAHASSGRIQLAEAKQTSQGLITGEWPDAEKRLNRASSLAPGLIEARLRLGRVLFLVDRVAEARRELERVRDEAPGSDHPFASCLAHLFLGQVYERLNRRADAEKAYQAAIQLQPHDQAPHLALGHLLVVSGRADEGWAAVRRMLADSAGGAAQRLESLDAYRSGQSWQTTARIAALEAWVRQ